MVRAVLKNNEDQKDLFRRFRKKMARSGVLGTVRRKRFYISESEKKQIALKKAIRREKRRRRSIH